MIRICMWCVIHFVWVNCHWVIWVIIYSNITNGSFNVLVIMILNIVHLKHAKTESYYWVCVIDGMDQSDLQHMQLHVNFNLLDGVSYAIVISSFIFITGNIMMGFLTIICRSTRKVLISFLLYNLTLWLDVSEKPDQSIDWFRMPVNLKNSKRYLYIHIDVVVTTAIPIPLHYLDLDQVLLVRTKLRVHYLWESRVILVFYL